MAHKIEWYVDQQVLLTSYWGEQTEDDVIASIRHGAALMRASSHPQVHIIADVSGLVKPLPFLKILNIMRQQTIPSQMGWAVIVGEMNSVVKFVIGGVSSISHLRVRSVGTMEDASAYLKQVDANIQWEKVQE